MMKHGKKPAGFFSMLFFFVSVSHPLDGSGFSTNSVRETGYVTALGDPGMKNDSLRVAIEAWNQCNEVGEETAHMGSPRMADCFDVDHSSSQGFPEKVRLIHKVDEIDNRLGVLNGTYGGINAKNGYVNQYAAEKEIYLGKKCQVDDTPRPWQFWMIMLKSGNTDTLAAICPENGKKSKPFNQTNRFPCFGKGCMNMPLVYHEYTRVVNRTGLKGSFFGTWDLDADASSGGWFGNDTSYFKVEWEKKVGKGNWVFHHLLKTSSKYPWLMLYFRADVSTGFSSGYHYQTRGMMKITPKSPNFKVKFHLDIKQGGGPGSQFYLMDIGSCWKNDGSPCDGDVTTDVTRYSEMILNPKSGSVCSSVSLKACPPYHTLPNGSVIHRTDKGRYPYQAYHYYCVPGNALFAEAPYETCDPYSNPQPQEILQILPHPVWGDYGYPTKKGEGWVGDPTSWELDVGRLSQSLYFYQDPGTKPAERYWPSIDLGTEMYMSKDQTAEWTVSDFDIVVPEHDM